MYGFMNVKVIWCFVSYDTFILNDNDKNGAHVSVVI